MVQRQGEESAKTTKVVIHHLSDIHYGLTAERHQAFDTYCDNIVKLPSDAMPDMIVITGDLTISGKAEELTAVAKMLRSVNGAMFRAHGHGICLMPGPHDLFWSDPRYGPDSKFWSDGGTHSREYADAVSKGYSDF